MADELDSGSSVGYYVWVQVPSSALYIREGLRRNPEVFLIGFMSIVEVSFVNSVQFLHLKTFLFFSNAVCVMENQFLSANLYIN